MATLRLKAMLNAHAVTILFICRFFFSFFDEPDKNQIV